MVTPDVCPCQERGRPHLSGVCVVGLWQGVKRGTPAVRAVSSALQSLRVGSTAKERIYLLLCSSFPLTL